MRLQERCGVARSSPRFIPAQTYLTSTTGSVQKNLLQSLTGADGVDGDGVLVQGHDDGENDRERDASQDKVPAGSGAPRNITGDDSGSVGS